MVVSWKRIIPIYKQQSSSSSWVAGWVIGLTWEWVGVGSDIISLFPYKLVLHRPFSGPLTKQIQKFYEIKGFYYITLALDQFLQVYQVTDQSTGYSLISTHLLLLDKDMANIDTKNNQGWGPSRCCWVGVVSPKAARLRWLVLGNPRQSLILKILKVKGGWSNKRAKSTHSGTSSLGSRIWTLGSGGRAKMGGKGSAYSPQLLESTISRSSTSRKR